MIRQTNTRSEKELAEEEGKESRGCHVHMLLNELRLITLLICDDFRSVVAACRQQDEMKEDAYPGRLCGFTPVPGGWIVESGIFCRQL